MLNQYLIPIYGINGAAIATGGVWLASGIVTALLIFSVYKMQPITKQVVLSIVLFAVVFLLNHLWNMNQVDLLLMGLVKTLALMGVTLFIILRFRLSEDVYSMAKKMLLPIGVKLKD
jgi:O-antigen/teichoic acid export membrane protein